MAKPAGGTRLALFARHVGKGRFQIMVKTRIAAPPLPLVGLCVAFFATGCAGALAPATVASSRDAALVDVAVPTPAPPSAASTEQRREAAALDRALKAAEAQVVEQQLALEAEIYAREDAERRADEAARCLLGLASVEHDPRGIVIALSGDELFDTGKASLLAGSNGALSEVANLLLNQNSTHSVVVHATGVEGDEHAAAGAESLAMRRADAIRRYFIARGVDASRISTGEHAARPASVVDAPSASLERPLVNSRIELVLRPPSSATAFAF